METVSSRKFVLAALAALSFGCAQPPTAPTPIRVTTSEARPALTHFWVMVIEQSGACIAGATVDGQAQETPCTVWEVSGGLVLRDLEVGVPITLRASAPGYVSRDVIVGPKSVGPGYNSVFEILLSRSQ